MLYGLNDNQEKILAEPSKVGFCPVCHSELIPKCGQIKIWHWAHKVKKDWCYYEPETQWHLHWKSLAPKERCEVRISKNGRYKIADCVLKSGKVVEFQHSFISPEEIQERENFYGNMMWIFNCIEPFNEERIDLRHKGKYVTFRWKHPKKHIAYCNKPTYLDLGDSSLRLKKMSTDCPVGGWGYLGNCQKLVEFIQTH